MDRGASPADDVVVQTLDHELGLVRGAIVMVAAGASRRVTLGGLRFGEELLEPARRLARSAGVRVVPLWTTDEGGAGLAIERIDAD